MLQHVLHGVTWDGKPYHDILLGWPGPALGRAVQPEAGQQHLLLLDRQAPGHCQTGHQIDTAQAGRSRRDVLLWLGLW
jgi:hypothetical protein